MTFLQEQLKLDQESSEEKKEMSNQNEQDQSIEIQDALSTPIMINPNNPIKDPGKSNFPQVNQF